MPCGCCGNGFIFGHLMYMLEKIAAFCAMTAIISCIIVTVIVSIGIGVGIGYNYCFVDMKTSKLTALENYRNSDNPPKLPKKPYATSFSGGSSKEKEVTTQNTNTFILMSTTKGLPTFPSIPNIPKISNFTPLTDNSSKNLGPTSQESFSGNTLGGSKSTLNDPSLKFIPETVNVPSDSKSTLELTVADGSESILDTPNIGGGSESIPDTPYIAEASESIPDTPNTADGSESIPDTPNTVHGSESIPDTPNIADGSESIPDTPKTADGSESIPDTSNTADGSESIPDTPYTADGSELIPDTPNTADGSESIPDTPNTADGSESIPDTPNTADESESIAETSNTADGSESIPDTPNTADGSESIPDTPNTADGSESIPDKPNTADGSESIPDTPNTADGSELIPDTPNTADGSESIPDTPNTVDGSESIPDTPNTADESESISDTPNIVDGSDSFPSTGNTKFISRESDYRKQNYVGIRANPYKPNRGQIPKRKLPIKEQFIHKIPQKPNFPGSSRNIPTNFRRNRPTASVRQPSGKKNHQRFEVGPRTNWRRKEFEEIREGVKANARKIDKGFGTSKSVNKTKNSKFRQTAKKQNNRRRMPVQRKKHNKFTRTTTIMPTIVIPLKKYANMSPLISKILAQNKNVTLQFITL